MTAVKFTRAVPHGAVAVFLDRSGRGVGRSKGGAVSAGGLALETPGPVPGRAAARPRGRAAACDIHYAGGASPVYGAPVSPAEE